MPDLIIIGITTGIMDRRWIQTIKPGTKWLSWPNPRNLRPHGKNKKHLRLNYEHLRKNLLKPQIQLNLLRSQQ
jgi:hypothetical protein